jgi:hypothetical protein
MNLTHITQMVLQGVSLSHWTVSHNGTRKGPVTEAQVGMRDGNTFWVRFRFQEDGTAHSIEGEWSLTGSPSTIRLDGISITSGHIVLATHIKVVPPHRSVEIDFDLQSQIGQYRFDAPVLQTPDDQRERALQSLLSLDAPVDDWTRMEDEIVRGAIEG